MNRAKVAAAGIIIVSLVPLMLLAFLFRPNEVPPVCEFDPASLEVNDLSFDDDPAGSKEEASMEGELTAGGDSHIWQVEGTVSGIERSANKITIDITWQNKGHFDGRQASFVCDQTFVDVSQFSIGQAVVVDYLLPNDTPNGKRAERVSPKL